MFAIVSIGNKQYKVEKGSVIYVEKLEGEKGSNVTIDKVLMVDSKIGKPYLEGATVECKIEKQVKAPKLTIIHHISQKHHTKKMGHRQPLTKLVVESIKLK